MKQHGQALVEFAIVLPVLLIMLLGLMEVGWILRSFLILDNVSRETARFASKVGTLNLEGQTVQEIGFTDVISHSNAALAHQLPLDYGQTGWIVISVVAIKTSWPCDPHKRESNDKDAWSNCNCLQPGFQPFTPTITMQPNTHPYLKYAIPATHTSHINYDEFAQELRESTEKIDCLTMKTSPLTTPSTNIAIIAEIGFDHRQLVKFFPGVDPIELYSRSIMRRAVSREE